MGHKRNRTKKSERNYINGIVTDKEEIISIKRALDGYSNIPANLGVGSNNLTQTARYVMQRFTWDYWTLNVLFRNNWIAKAIIEKPANEMLKNGFEIQTELDPDNVTKIEKTWRTTGTRDKFLNCLKWSRLYGGCILLPMIEGQEDLSTPLDYDTILPGSYKGCFTVDRWSGVSPSGEIVEDISDPEFGEPESYLVSLDDGNSVKIHHSRIIKMIGRKLPHWEEVAESYWGASELEHVYEELKKRDDTSSNISFLIFLANIRVFSIQDLGQMISMGDQRGLQRVYETMSSMNSLMANTGTLAMDKDDSFSTQQYSFTGINDIYESFMLDISGAAEIPVDKLFGRSPTGFNSGEETLQNYYDMIQEKQETYIRYPLEKILKIICMSELGKIPDDFEVSFNPIRRQSDDKRATLAQTTAQTIFEGYNLGIYGKGTVLRELKQLNPLTGIWSNITDKMIQEADEQDEEAKRNEEMDRQELNSGIEGVLNDVLEKEK